MEYKLFDDYVTLQALFKELGIIQSGGAIKSFLAENIVLFNGEDEKRRGKKIRLGDQIDLPELDIHISLVAPTDQELMQHQEDLAEKERVKSIVKQLNQENKQINKTTKNKQKSRKRTRQQATKGRKPVRFPGI